MRTPGAPLGLRELQESGLLHEINEQVLWPHGLALTLDVPNDEPGNEATRRWEDARLYVQDLGEVIESGLSADEHAALHERLRAWCADRMAGLGPST